MKAIHLHGALKTLSAGPQITIDVHSPLEALRFLASVLPGFYIAISTHAYFVAIRNSGTGSEARLAPSDYGISFGSYDEYHIIPDATGAKVGGIARGISPEASAYEAREDETVSALFNGGVNTTEQSMCVPVIYGRVRRAGSAVISAGIAVEDVPLPVPLREDSEWDGDLR